MANIAIVGAGVIGVSCAAFLQRDGHSVTIYDPLPPGEGCSFGNAGSIGPGSVVPLSTPGIVRQAASWITDPDSPLWIDWRYLPRALPWLIKFISAGARPRINEIAKALRALHADSFKHYRSLLGIDAASLLHVSGQLYLYESDAAFARATGLVIMPRRSDGREQNSAEGAAQLSFLSERSRRLSRRSAA